MASSTPPAPPSPPSVRTRFAPSPTGYLHIGSVRTALFNWLFAKGSPGGSFILRIEDTDTARSRSEFETAIMEDLKWLGLLWDEGPQTGGGRGEKGPYRQSERLEIYRDYAGKLLKDGLAYMCYCSMERLAGLRREQAHKGVPPRYDSRCRSIPSKDAPKGVTPALRFRVPERNVTFADGAHGNLSFDTETFGDFVIMGSDGVASYNFAVVLDDALMSITHIIRGDDHVSNTPRQILLFEALGFNIPSFTHIPLVLAPDRTPLGKRHSSASIRSLKEAGFLPGAILNASARLGCSLGDEFLTLDEMALSFSLKRLSVSPSIFDEERLKSFNRAALERMSMDEIMGLTGFSEEGMKAVIEAVRPAAATLNDIKRLASPFIKGVALTGETRAALTEPYAKAVLEAFLNEFEKAATLDGASYDRIVSDVKTKTGEKGRRLYMPLRCALTGKEEGVELVKVVRLLGREKAVERIRAALSA